MIENNLLFDARDAQLREMVISVKGIEEVREYAQLKHLDQTYGDKPYIFHLDDVSVIAYSAMRLAGVDDASMQVVLKATYTHDVLEDTDTTEDELETVICESIKAVKYATKDPLHKRSDALVALIAKTHALDVEGKIIDLVSLIVKMSDGLANRIRSASGSDMTSKRLNITYKSELADLHPAYATHQEKDFVHAELGETYLLLLAALALYL